MIPYATIGLAIALGVSVLYGMDADRALDREQKARAVAEASAKSFAQGLTQCRAEIAEKNAIIHRFQGLDERRLRICVTRPPNDPCCRPAPAPPEKDGCAP